MKQQVKVAVLVGALLGLGFGTQANAATEAKKAQPVARKSEQKKVAAAPQPAGKSTSTTARKSVAKAPVKASGKTAKRGSGKTVIAANDSAKKPMRRVSMADVDPGRLALFSASAVVIDQDSGQSLLEKQSDAVLPIASISKLMTAMVVLDAKLDLNEVIAIGDEDVDDLKGTRSRLPVGTTMTRETAMLLALMSSENRAANSLGRHYPGGMPAFVRAMNQKARALGMNSSRFDEPTGLSSNNVSTAHDLARMVAAAARYPEIRAYSTTSEARVDVRGACSRFSQYQCAGA